MKLEKISTKNRPLEYLRDAIAEVTLVDLCNRLIINRFK
ncbi:MAG: hypothetical protein ACI848_001535 [Roseivirga sp.]